MNRTIKLKNKYIKPTIKSKKLATPSFSSGFSVGDDDVLLAVCYGCTSCGPGPKYNCGNYTCIKGYCSDKQLKKNITKLGSVSEKIQNIQGVYFEWNKKGKSIVQPTRIKEIGLIAQQVKNEFPELVIKRPDNYLAIDYPKLTAVLIEAIKELQEKQTKLELQIKKNLKSL
ncbi:MAG: tail fiber domain-containing protein [Cyanobacteria bacterium]|nr:tail fiber domain-containing protein [Cyanobacteriota bacterium]